VWDVTTGQEIATLVGHTSAPWGVAFSPDGAHVATSSPDGTVRIYVLDTDELMALAQSRVTRSLTTEECQKYLHVDECPQRP
jgi:WD40 repeat protein